MNSVIETMNINLDRLQEIVIEGLGVVWSFVSGRLGETEQQFFYSLNYDINDLIYSIIVT